MSGRGLAALPKLLFLAQDLQAGIFYEQCPLLTELTPNERVVGVKFLISDFK